MILKNNFINKLVILTGPSAVGKDTLVNELVKYLPLKKVVATTTRKPRINEVAGVDYYFVSRDSFKELISKGLMFEYNKFDGQYYGRQKRDVKKVITTGFVPLLIIDPDRALDLQKNHPEALIIFIKSESMMILKKRLIARGLSLDDIDKRLRLAKIAMQQEPVFAYTVINRDGHLDDTVKTIKKIIKTYLGI